VPAFAQGNGRNSARAQGIPPGQLPPDGLCRVWYEGRPPGQQPRPVDCNQAERIASRDSRARVIYGADRGRRDDDDRWGDRRDRDDRNDRYGRNGNYGRYGYGNQMAFDNGYNDGLQKGREDAHERKSYDPVRQKWYRDASRGYKGQYGAKEQYRNVYRDGFESGYSAGYRDNGGVRDNRRPGGIGGINRRWP